MEVVRRYETTASRITDALHPSTAPWAVSTGVRAIVAAAIIALAGVAFGEPASIGVAYFAATMSTLFAVGGSHRARLSAMFAQGIGAILGLIAGAASPTSVVGFVLVAAAMALIGGLVSAIDPALSAFSLLLVVGTAYGQFGGSPLGVGQQCLWYAIGSVIVSVLVASQFITVAPQRERSAVRSLLVANADLLDAIGTPEAGTARRTLADAAAACRAALYGYRWTARPDDQLEASAQAARRATLVVLTFYARGVSVSPEAAQVLRQVATDGRPIAVPRAIEPEARALVAALAAPVLDRTADDTESAVPPSLRQRLQAVRRGATTPAALGTAIRLALCVAIATGAAASLHGEHHAFWLVLTVAVVVRPELQSVFARVVNRIAGTLVGALLSAVVLWTAPGDWALATAAAIAMGLSALSAPKVYGLFVIGITASTLLSASIGEVNPLAPELRLLDTLIGCAIAVVIGYARWPGTRPVASAAKRSAADAAVQYLRAAVDPESQSLGERRRQAYDLSHRLRLSLQSAAPEPIILRPTIRTDLPVAMALEDVLDDVTDLADTVRTTGAQPPSEAVEAVVQQIVAVGRGNARADHGARVTFEGGTPPLERMSRTLTAFAATSSSA